MHNLSFIESPIQLYQRNIHPSPNERNVAVEVSPQYKRKLKIKHTKAYKVSTKTLFKYIPINVASRQ